VRARGRLVLTEAWSSLTANVSTTFAALMTVLIGMLLLGVFLALGTWVLSWGHHIKKELQVNVYFCTDTDGAPCHGRATATQEQQTRQLLAADPAVRSVQFVSRDVAFRQQSKLHPDMYAGLPSNPLPDKYVVTPKRGEDVPALVQRLQRSPLQGVAPAPNGVVGPGKTGKRVLTVARWISLVFLIAVVLLVVASTLLIANTIRLSIFARRREVEVMKLVGATNWFIRGPFMLEGLLTGLAGSVIAVVLLVLGKEIALPHILGHIDGGNSDVHALPFALNVLCMVGGGLILGAIGSGLTLRRFLQV
jgi:cell division transport system permease protein